MRTSRKDDRDGPCLLTCSRATFPSSVTKSTRLTHAARSLFSCVSDLEVGKGPTPSSTLYILLNPMNAKLGEPRSRNRPRAMHVGEVLLQIVHSNPLQVCLTRLRPEQMPHRRLLEVDLPPIQA